MSNAVEVVTAVPKTIIAECNRYEITPGVIAETIASSVVISVATYGAQTLSSTVSFAAKASDYALKSAANATVTYGISLYTSRFPLNLAVACLS